MTVHWLVIAFLIGCKGDAPAPAKAPPVLKQSVPRTMEELATVCTGTAFSDAPPFARSTDPEKPSDIVVLAKYADEGSSMYRRQQMHLPLGSQLDVRTTPLVACLDVKRVESPPPVTCQGNIKRYASDVSLRVVEVKTAKQLGADRIALGRGAGLCSSREREGGPKDFTLAAFDGWLFTELEPFMAAGVKRPVTYATSIETACDGAPVPGAALHTPGAKGQVRIFVHDEDGRSTSSFAMFGELDTKSEPEDGMKYDVVACVTERRGAKVRDCRFDGGATLAIHAATFEVNVVEARTSRVLETKTFASVTKDACPYMWNFGNGDHAALRAVPAAGKYLETFGKLSN